MIALVALAAQLAVTAHAPDVANACEAIEITVDVSAPGGAQAVLEAPSLAPFDILRSSPAPHVVMDAKHGGVVAEYRFVVTTDRVGAFSLPPFVAKLGATIARSQPVQIVVKPTPATGNAPSVIARARIDTGLDVSFRAATVPETVYVGQQANYEVAVFLNAAVRDRLRRNPTFFPPDMQSMLAYDLPTTGEPPRRRVSSQCFDALVYQRALFPLLPGRLSIPPAQLVYALPLSSSFFSREETHELETDSAIVIAVPPPLSGRPREYTGAVGDLRVAARVDTTATRVGDPLVLTLEVHGRGNVKLFPRPQVAVPWASLVNGDERVRVDTTARRIAGSKEFDWVLTPRIAGELDLPPIHYSYFNPDNRRYEVASTSPQRVHVALGALASSDTARTETVLSLRTRYRGVPRAPLHRRPVFWALLALAPLPALSLGARERRRRAIVAPPTPAARLESLVVQNAVEDPCELRRAFTGALAARLGIEPESFTRAGALARILRRRGVSTEVALDAERFLRQLDEAAFASRGVLPADASRRAAELYRKADEEALHQVHFGRSLGVVIALLISGAAAMHALDLSVAQREFDRGVAAYERHAFVAARDAFVKSAVANPDAPDAWANLGTAAWASADTARSVAGWQHALRAEPLATDVRERIELVHALPMSAAGYVPPLPASWIFDAAALIWLLAWGAAAWTFLRARPARSRELGFVAVLALAMIIGGIALEDRVSGRDLAVVRRTRSLASDPSLGAEPGPTAIIGEVVKVRGRQGAWMHVVLDDGRDGWLESASLLPLGSRDAISIASD
ncbi:MAG TPA: BatD family protein [Gemmatimonadaceae bacterium]